jgi:hypothetical protein
LLAQVLAASTYPLELLQMSQWLARNPGLKDKALADAVAQQPWDASIQAMAALPDVTKRLADDIQWTTDLGNAFLAQQGDVMHAVQRMRQKAEDKGSLKSTKEQVVETKTIENREVIVIEQANPQVVYVPSYDPVTVYGPPVYPIRPSTIRRRDTTPRVRRFRLASASRWARPGAAAGGGTPAGDTTTSPSTTTTISIATRTSTAGIASATTPGSTGPSIAAALRIATVRRRTGTAARPAETLSPTVRRVPVSSLGARAATFAVVRSARQALAIALVPRGAADRTGAGGLGDRGGAAGLGDRAGTGSVGDRGGASSRGSSTQFGNRPVGSADSIGSRSIFSRG